VGQAVPAQCFREPSICLESSDGEVDPPTFRLGEPEADWAAKAQEVAAASAALAWVAMGGLAWVLSLN